MAICSNSKTTFRKRKSREDEYGGISRMKKDHDVAKHAHIICNGWRSARSPHEMAPVPVNILLCIRSLIWRCSLSKVICRRRRCYMFGYGGSIIAFVRCWIGASWECSRKGALLLAVFFVAATGFPYVWTFVRIRWCAHLCYYFRVQSRRYVGFGRMDLPTRRHIVHQGP